MGVSCPTSPTTSSELYRRLCKALELRLKALKKIELIGLR